MEFIDLNYKTINESNYQNIIRALINDVIVLHKQVETLQDDINKVVENQSYENR